MSDNPKRSGIGGIAAVSGDEMPAPAEHAARLVEAAHAFPDPQAQHDAFMAEIRGTLEALRVATVGSGDRQDALERSVAQLQGQMAQIELALPQHVHAIQTFDARMTAMARQIAQNIRLAVLEHAVKARGVGDPSSTVMKLATEFLAFVEGGSVGSAGAAKEAEGQRPSNTVAH